MPFFIINGQKRIVALADSCPTQEQLQRMADKMGSILYVIDGRDTGMNAEPASDQETTPKTMHLSGLDAKVSTGLLRIEDLNLDPQEEIISLLASLPERDRRLLARELRHRLVP